MSSPTIDRNAIGNVHQTSMHLQINGNEIDVQLHPIEGTDKWSLTIRGWPMYLSIHGTPKRLLDLASQIESCCRLLDEDYAKWIEEESRKEEQQTTQQPKKIAGRVSSNPHV